MKKHIAFLGALALATMYVHAQGKYDFSYSTSNYKHPNKAKIAAEQLESYKAQPEYASVDANTGLEASQNYKSGFAPARRKNRPAGIILSVPVSAPENAITAPGNYKSGFRPTTRQRTAKSNVQPIVQNPEATDPTN